MITSMLPLLTAVAAQLFDLGTFIVMVRRFGAEAEANPLVAAIFADYGTPLVALAKLSVLLLVVALAVSTARRSPRVRLFAGALPVTVAIIAGLIGGLSNARVILG
jgi:hypothetical protein